MLHYCPCTASKIINTCVILHNFAIHHNLPLFFQDVVYDEDLEDIDDVQIPDNDRDNRDAGELVRGALRDYLYRNT